MDYTAAIIACLMLVTAIWMLLHGIRGYQKGVIIETRKSSPIKDYYYRGDFGFTSIYFLYCCWYGDGRFSAGYFSAVSPIGSCYNFPADKLSTLARSSSTLIAAIYRAMSG